jgi:hypothetical protein
LMVAFLASACVVTATLRLARNPCVLAQVIQPLRW